MKHWKINVVICGLTTLLLIFAFQSSEAQNGGFCTQTAQTMFSACKADTTDNAFVKKANCMNVEDPQEREECLGDLEDDRQEDTQLCNDQLRWRKEACKAIGEDRYDPDIDPSTFETDFNNLAHPNPFYPLKIGNKWK